MPTLNFGALQPVADSTGLTPYLESSLPPSSSDGLANPNPKQQQQAAPVEDFLKSFQDKPPAPALPLNDEVLPLVPPPPLWQAVLLLL